MIPFYTSHQIDWKERENSRFEQAQPSATAGIISSRQNTKNPTIQEFYTTWKDLEMHTYVQG